MKKIIYFLIIFYTLHSFAQVTITPTPFQMNQSITITVDANSNATDCNGFSNPSKVYLHSGVGTDTAPFTHVKGNWGTDDGVGEMTNNNNGTWSITFIPTNYYGLTATQAAAVTKMGMVFRNENGSQEFKGNGCTDFIVNVGSFQASLTAPTSSTTVLASGGSLQITATNTNGNADYNLKVNGTSIHTANTNTYSYTHTGITTNQKYELQITQSGASISKFFEVIINPGTVSQAMPTGLKNGINYNNSDTTKATLVLDAPLKDFVYVAGSFNNWIPTSSYAMKKDPATGKFWFELTGLTSGQVYTYQYWVVDTSPIANSPTLVKTADPFSTLVLSPFDDPHIAATTYPNLPTYPVGQKREVTVLQTAQTPYVWNVNNFTKPKKEDLVIYEVLVRDFDSDRNFQDLIDRIDYFKNLNINAIEIMPVMEFEGNEGWGYNPSFHMALDKFYGTKNKFKEFIDLCHQNGIAVILDIALNHAFGRNPMVRMWMNDADNDGWGEPSSENPYFNQTATHAYGIGADFNHQQAKTQQYVKQVVKHWIEEFKIDGFRWDLTKGFTQNCTSGDESCTNTYQADRVAILKEYADYSWSIDPSHYVIFEHLGTDNEEKEWADYKVSEGKGIMLWGNMSPAYNQLTMGFATNANITRMGHKSRNFNKPRLIGYAESHDEERLMYNNLQNGNSALGSHNVKNLNTALSRMSALGAASLTIPGPKMIWHFGALGMENSIYTCTNGSVNTNTDAISGECKLDTKPQPQWANNWMSDANRTKIYNDWARLIDLKINEPVFEGNYDISNYVNDIRQRIYIWDNSLPSSQIQNVVILCNFSVADLPIVPDFPYTGTWYDLMDKTNNTTINVTNTATPITIPAGQFRIFGNRQSVLSTSNVQLDAINTLYPNPTANYFMTSKKAENISIFNMLGKKIATFKNIAKNSPVHIHNLKNGMYLVHIKSNNKTQIQKLIISK